MFICDKLNIKWAAVLPKMDLKKIRYAFIYAKWLFQTVGIDSIQYN